MPGRPSSGEPSATEHYVPLGNTGWVLWREAAVRGAGFPATRILEICDDPLATAADALTDRVPTTRQHFATVYAEATDRLSAAIRRTARDSRFREAVTWKNPTLIENCLDKAAAGRRRNTRGRYYEATIASYLQRFCVKNDSIGFFGPVGWARIGTEDTSLTVTPGPDLLARRTTYLEDWPIKAVADVIAGRPDVWPWLLPQMVPHGSLTGLVLHLPFTRPLTLSPAQARLLRRCDGRHTVRDLVGDPADPTRTAALVWLHERGAVRIDLNGPRGSWPERDLAARIATIGDPDVRARARALLDEVIAARDAVAAAAGQPDRLVLALGALAETFERVTGRKPTRRQGELYAGRTLVYEDTVRGVDVHIGHRLTERLAAPLGQVLDSALWLVNTLGQRYEAAALQLLDRERARSGRDSYPLLRLMAAILPELLEPGRMTTDSTIVDEVLVDFQDRWHRVLELPPEAAVGVRRWHVTSDGIADRVAVEFATGPPRWSGARWHSPDIMVATNDRNKLARGDVEFVLGELHVGCNTLEGGLFVAQHPAVERLRAAALASQLTGRVVFVSQRGSDYPSARISRAADLMLPSYTYLHTGGGSLAPPPGATALSAMDLSVARQGEHVVVRHRAGAEYPFLEIIGEPLMALFLSGFQPIRGCRHRPRVTIDRLVLRRETWTFPAAELEWAFIHDEAGRYAGARRWRSAHGLPDRGFLRVPVERKPVAVDFRSLPLVNLFAKSVRRTVEAGPGEVTITEMLPDLDQLWLTDAQGARYTAELRLVAVRDPR